MKRAVGIVVVIVVLAGAAGGAWWYLNGHPEWRAWLQQQYRQAVGQLGLGGGPVVQGLAASGFIEADEASVGTDLGGRIIALNADEGDEVTKDQVMVQLDDSLLLPQIETAKAELAAAEAQLAQVKAAVRPETLDHALAQLQQAQAAQDVAQVAWEDARAMQKNPQDLEIAITAAQSALGVLDLQTKQSQAMANSAQAARDMADQIVAMLEDFKPFTIRIPIDGMVFSKTIKKLPSTALPDARYQQAQSTYESWKAWTGYEQAQAALAGAESHLKELEQQKNKPLVLQAQTDVARSQYEVAVAGVALAQAQVDGLKMGATPEQIAAVQAQVDVARAALETLYLKQQKLALTAPITGLVLERPVEVGEVALPGAPLMTLADLDKLTLTVYVPENQLGQVQLGQPVAVTVDAYPGRTFAGTVSFIASQAEFTPKNVQTREERVSMVFAVKVTLPNPDHALKPGMPADAVLEDGTQGGNS
jgi:HlyD family secretion protein